MTTATRAKHHEGGKFRPGQLTNSAGANSDDDTSGGGDASPNGGGGASPSDGGANPSDAGPSRDGVHG
ncbi:MAG TPA: hypothetical protein VJS63_03445, partial [Bradyrhizobium sp.]|nr:hypothetical protein [Bradyrhizobium sp.]